MGLRDAIGIDPDSKGFVCATVKVSGAPVTTKGYMTQGIGTEGFDLPIRSFSFSPATTGGSPRR